ncbi:IS3 family transposase [Cytophagaceae bacterium ABcell3]|nr:IS3 family transposase [Cytophagaceae bacterium ABcell3]WMJ73034.1 IS3 family transposase [Cytophagaceae bacterium ABcell3]WMJ73245.1 IS3 family transposase [Cytophagaceae bacterium ABcell3]WMJ73610.1 IS3 family transposase [Cytophagaceae bacterium ABcell3]WMJ74307.1 IS3 family transposase [Cytophagaceae bacterium ABcell3]
MDHRKEYAVEKMCRTFNVARNSFYEWKKEKQLKLAQQRAILLKEIKTVHELSNGTYGSPRITLDLRKKGFAVSRPRVARIMKDHGIRSVVSKKFKVCTTDSNHGFSISPNVLDRSFKPESPSKSWVSDITYIRTNEAWLYLTMIMDLYDRKIIGWSMSTSMHAYETVVPAWRMALINRPVFQELVFHSDRGVQYACKEFRDELGKLNVTQSMSRKGNCWDNAVAESFFKTLKSETGYRKYESIKQAKKGLFEYIEIWYNRTRRHSSLGYLSPEEFYNIHRKSAA